LQGDRWTAAGLELYNGDVISVEAHGVVDEFGNFNGQPSNSVTIEGFRDRPPEIVATQLAYTGATSGTVGRTAPVSAVLTTVAGEPLADKTITFTRGSRSTSAVTTSDGSASSTIKIGGPTGSSVPIVVDFAGDDKLAPAQLTVPFQAEAKHKDPKPKASRMSAWVPGSAFAVIFVGSIAGLVLLRSRRLATAIARLRE
jgi:hypothetical protein